MKTKIIIHCSDTPKEMDIGAAEIKVWHTTPKPRGNGWSDIGYAYIIRRNGELELGRDTDSDGDVVEETGAHAAYHNASTVGICLVGGRKSGKTIGPENNFTEQQMKVLRWLVIELTSRFPSIKDVIGHRDLPGVNKYCPSFDAISWWDGVKAETITA